MPQLVHGLVGLALGVSTARDPQSPWVRRTWIGGVFLLSYLPDVTEWLLRLCGVRMPHSAPASLPCTVLGCAGVYAALRWGLREKSRLAIAVALTALASHMLLDAISGGIPLWWPFSRAEVGNDWLSFDQYPDFVARLKREAIVCAPLLSVAMIVATVRSHCGAAVIVANAFALGGVLIAVFGGSFIAAYSVLTLQGLITLMGAWPGWKLAYLWQAVPALPVVALALVQILVWDHMREGLRLHRSAQYEAAIERYDAASRWTGLGFEGTAMARIAQCLVGLGHDERAAALIEDGEKRYPYQREFRIGRAELYLMSRDPRYHKPRNALVLVDELLAYGGTQAETGYYRGLRETALEQIRTAGSAP